MDLIQSAIDQGQQALSEYASKQFLATYDIPVTHEIMTTDASEAVSAARQIGFPVALKACGPKLMHKSEAGVIELNLKSDADVEAAYERIASKPGLEMEGVLVQEMIKGSRELVVGLLRDPQFGPCVMLGLGGVMTEIIRDTVFRVAPFDRREAEDMASELKSKAMLAEFRGQKAADLETLYRCLTAVGDIGMKHDAVAEIDINPLIIDPEGRIVAVDALVVLEKGQ